MSEMLALEEFLEIFLKLLVGSCGGCVPGNDDNVVPKAEGVAMFPHYLAHAPAKQYADNCVSEFPGGDNPESGFFRARTLAGIRQGAEHKKTPCC